MSLEHKFILEGVTDYDNQGDDLIVWAQECRAEYHSMHELYEHRMALNIAFFNLLWKQAGFADKVIKSKLHADGTMFEGYFIVMAITFEGQISYHYKLKHWDKFRIPEVERTPIWDGQGSMQVMERLMKL